MQTPPIFVSHLFSKLDELLIELLQSLNKEEWEAQTVARLWKVKDVAAHLLDGNIRALSIQRDRYFGISSAHVQNYNDLVQWLNELNAEWVNASKRISPSVLIFLHQSTGKLVSEYFALLDPFEPAIFPVSWAGENESFNWMHVAREYTEKWLHQQQIRDAVKKPAILTKEFYQPFLQTFMYALPHTYRNTPAKEGTGVCVHVTGDAGGKWKIIRRNEVWQLTNDLRETTAELIIDPDLAWKLFSKSLHPEEAKKHVIIKGNEKLGEFALGMVSVMA